MSDNQHDDGDDRAAEPDEAASTKGWSLPRSRPLTRADLDDLPDTGQRYELIDGTLFVSPPPSASHQVVSVNLLKSLHAACPRELGLIARPLGVTVSDATILRPDQVVARGADVGERDRTAVPLLSAVIVSACTRLFDTTLKKAVLKEAGCPSYWVVDPEVPSLVAWERRDGAYVEVASVKADEVFHATSPFSVDVRPADLIL